MNVFIESKRLIAHFTTALVIAGEVILINLLGYAADIYLPSTVGPYLSFEILFCLPLLQAAQLVAVGPLQTSGNLNITLIAVTMAVIWSKVEASIDPSFPLPILLLNIFTRGVALTVLGRTFLVLWHDRETANHHIGKQKIIENSLRLSENKLAKALNMAKAGSWDYSVPEDTFTFDDTFYKIFHTSVDEVGSFEMSAAEYSRRFVHPEDRHMVGEAIREAVESDDRQLSRDLEHRFIFRDGEIGYMKVRFFTVYDSTGSAIKLYGVNLDITERKKVEDTLLNLNQKLEELSNQDGLLSIANRRHFDVKLDEEWSRAKRNQQPLSLLMIDVDWFKHYNDTYGHQAGDKALTAVARCAESALNRPGDLLSRYGGEELTVILPNTNSLGAFAVAERIQHKLAHELIPHNGIEESSYLTVSIGVATMSPDDHLSPNMLIKEADEGLYLAKEGGRNRIGLADNVTRLPTSVDQTAKLDQQDPNQPTDEP